MRDRLRRLRERPLSTARVAVRRRVVAFLRWAETTDNLVHLSILIFVPTMLVAVTVLSNMTTALPFLLFPPLASGTYTLFARPESEYASPRRFVFGLTAGAFCGYVSFQVAERYFHLTGPAFGIHPVAVALSVLLTAAVTWALDIEEPTAFSSALLIHVIEVESVTALSLRLTPSVVVSLSPRSAYVVSVFLSTTFVALVFIVWREEFYEERAHYLYGTTQGDDHVLVPMRGESAERTAMFGARLAAPHEAGKVVLFGMVDDPDEDASLPTHREREAADEEHNEAVEKRVAELDETADRIRTRVGVSCEVVVAAGQPGPAAIDAAQRTNCDLVVTPYEEDRGSLSPFVREIFDGPIDAVAFRSRGERARWKRVLVTVARPGDAAHAMVDFATRLAGRTGTVSVCTCIGAEGNRRRAEHGLADVVETFEGPIETRVSRSSVTEFIEANAAAYDLVVLGSSGGRSKASRFVSPPTFERLREVDCDVAVVDRGWE